MKNNLIIILCTGLPVLLGACTEMRETTTRAFDVMQQNSSDTAQKFADYLRVKPKPVKQPLKPSYCYRALQDVICYNEPQPGQEHRLVAWQGPAGESTPVAIRNEQVQVKDTMMVESARTVQAGPSDPKPIYVAPAPGAKSDPEAIRLGAMPVTDQLY